MTPSALSGNGNDAFRHYSGKVSRQAFVFLVGTLFSVVFGYLFKAYLGRVLGAEALGLYALGLQTVGLLVMLAGLGMPAVLARYVAVYLSRSDTARIRPLLQQAAWRTLAVSGLAAVILWGLRRPIAEGLFAAPGLTPYVPLFALLVPLSAGNSLLGQYARGHQSVAWRTVIHHFVQLPLKIAVTLALLHWGLGLTGYIAAELVSQCVAIVLLTVLASRLTPSSVRPGNRSGGDALGLDAENRAYGRQMLVLESLRFLSGRVDILLLGILATTQQVGIYSMAVASAAFVPTLLRALVSIFGPVISTLHSRGEMALLQRLYTTTTRWCLCLTFPLVAVLVVFAPTLMGLFGAEFRAGSTALIWLVLGQLVNVGTGAVGNLLVMSGHQRLELWASVFTAGSTVALAWICIPLWGISGAGAAVGLGLALANGLRLVLVRRVLSLQAYDAGSLKLALPLIAAAACPMLSAQVWGHSSWLGVAVALPAAYLALAITIRPLISADDRLLMQRVGRRRPTDDASASPL